jgi:hypothetical protein
MPQETQHEKTEAERGTGWVWPARMKQQLNKQTSIKNMINKVTES